MLPAFLLEEGLMRIHHKTGHGQTIGNIIIGGVMMPGSIFHADAVIGPDFINQLLKPVILERWDGEIRDYNVNMGNESIMIDVFITRKSIPLKIQFVIDDISLEFKPERHAMTVSFSRALSLDTRTNNSIMARLSGILSPLSGLLVDKELRRQPWIRMVGDKAVLDLDNIPEFSDTIKGKLFGMPILSLCDVEFKGFSEDGIILGIGMRSLSQQDRKD
jgi:hypothetical protein